MNRFLLSLKRPFIWLCRFRHRRGYGVHSPFAFSFIKGVVFERTAYYGYAPLREQEKEMARREGRGVLAEGLRVRRLLFRVANYAHPATIIDVGVPAASSLYLKAACGGAVYTERCFVSVRLGLPPIQCLWWKASAIRPSCRPCGSVCARTDG